jgi:branched-chain amino acid transport system substrate-binding protein
MSSSPATTEGRRFVFRLASPDEAQGRAIGEFAATELGARRAGVLFDVSTDYSRSLAEAFRRAFEEAGGRVVAFETFARDEPMAYRKQLERIRESKPDVLYLPNDGERSRVQILQARAHGISATLLGGDTWDLDLFRSFPECEGAFIAHQWHPDADTPEAKRFRADFQKTYGKAPKITTAMTYDAVKLILSVIERVGSFEASRVRDGIAATREFTGVTGTVRFSAGSEPERAVAIARITGGQSRLHRLIEPEERAP